MSVTFNEAAARSWAEAFSSTLAVRYISPNGVLYLERYFSGAQFGPAVFLHHFVASDPDGELHSHPWDWSVSLILAGGYREQRCGRDGKPQEREYRAGALNVLEASDRHRIDLLERDCWTLFLAGRYVQPWAMSPSCPPGSTR